MKNARMTATDEYDFIKDPEHKHFPGVSYHRTKTGWSNAVKTERNSNGKNEDETTVVKPVFTRHIEPMEEGSTLVEGICNGNYFHISTDLSTDSADDYTSQMISSNISHTVLENHLDPKNLNRDGYLKVLRSLSDRFQVLRVHLYQEMDD